MFTRGAGRGIGCGVGCDVDGGEVGCGAGIGTVGCWLLLLLLILFILPNRVKIANYASGETATHQAQVSHRVKRSLPCVVAES